ncbi:MAG TPA: plastocyanin/azurin family copper-binding protein, partial [Chitinophagaceae bacterium]|nr:plastocyanin/azurin family copper-binding protein [Chitinophagaceae bacterium]
NNPYAVNIAGFAFSSASLTVPSGTSVTWKNMDNVNHTVTANDGSFDSGDIVPGATFSHTFSSVGSFSYHCKHHTYMTGTVTVQ